MADEPEELDAVEEIDDNEEDYPADLGNEDGLPEDDSHDEDDDGGLNEPGGVDSEATEEDEGSLPEPQMPDPPAGFKNWQDAYGAANRRAQDLEYQSQDRGYEQARQAQSQQQTPQGFTWETPHKITPDVQMAMRLRGTEQYEQLSPVVRGRAEEVSAYMANHWNRWTHDPNAFVNDVVIPQVAPAIRHLTEQLAQLQAAEFKRKHQDDLQNQEDLTRYMGMVEQVQRDPYAAGLEMMRTQRALEEAQAAAQGNKTRSKDKQAKGRSARGRAPSKTRTKGRRGKRKTTMSKAEKANPAAVAQNVMRQMREAGELTQQEIDG